MENTTEDKTAGQTRSEDQSLEEWLAEERARLDKGFTFEPQPTSAPSQPGTAEQALAGLGLGAGVAAGVAAPHPNPVTFQGCPALVIVNALRTEIQNDDTQVQVDQTGDSTVITVLQNQEPRPYDFFPALSVTMIEKADTLTVTVSDLDQDTVRGALGSMGSTLLDQGKRVITGRARGVGGIFDAAGHVMKGVEDLVEDIQDLGLPRRVWKVVDRVGEAAEKAYLDEQRQNQERQRQREADIRAWTHCAWCGRAYGTDEADTTSCPSCGAARGPKPDSLA
jgi:hypothetical protein